MSKFAKIALAVAVTIASGSARAEVIELTPAAERGLTSPFGGMISDLAIGSFSIVDFQFVLEFALAAIPNDAAINSASLGLRVDRYDAEAGVYVRGYSGDGVGNLGDLYAGDYIRSLAPPDTSLNFYDVTDFIAGQVALGADFAGLGFYHDGPCALNAGIRNCRRTFDNSAGVDYPRLVIDFEPRAVSPTPTPAPAAPALFALGLAAVAGRHRRGR